MNVWESKKKYQLMFFLSILESIMLTEYLQLKYSAEILTNLSSPLLIWLQISIAQNKKTIL